MSQGSLPPDLFAQQMAGKSAGKSGEDKVNDGLSAGDPKRLAATAGKIASAVMPVPVNIGAVLDHGGVFQGLETEGWAGKTISSGIVPSSQGGLLAKLLYDVFVKNGKVEDLTGGIQPMAWTDMPISALGGLTPSAGGGQSASIELS